MFFLIQAPESYKNVTDVVETCKFNFIRPYTVLPRNQAHVRKGENTLFWVLIVVHFCSLLGACASYGMQFGMQFVRPHRTRIQTMQS